MTDSPVHNRTTSAFPISIGTSLSLESIFKGTKQAYDPSRVIPNNINISDYDFFWVNLLTLFRNIMGSMDSQSQSSVTIDALVDTMQIETDLIKELVTSGSNGITKTIFYASRYKDLEKVYPHATIRKDSTEKQKVYSALMQNTINTFIKSAEKDAIQLFDLDITPKEKHKALILSHYAYDLTNYNKFEKLDLIESHTGVLKTRNLFYQKFTNGKDLVRIPFNKCFIQVFGDSQTFSSFPAKAKLLIIELANKYNWTSITTKDRVIFCLDTLSDKYLATMLKTML